MRFEVEQDEGAQDARLAHRGRQMERAFVRGPGDEAEPGRDGDRPAVGALQPTLEQFTQACDDERERLEPLNRPFELASLTVAHALIDGRQWAFVFARRNLMQPNTVRTEPSAQIAASQPREVAQRREPPSPKNLETLEVRREAKPDRRHGSHRHDLQRLDRQWRERGGFPARHGNRYSRLDVRQEPGGRHLSREADAHLQTPFGRQARYLGGDARRRAYRTIEATRVEHSRVVTPGHHARRARARDGLERAGHRGA
jgi:hypothetical protein